MPDSLEGVMKKLGEVILTLLILYVAGLLIVAFWNGESLGLESEKGCFIGLMLVVLFIAEKNWAAGCFTLAYVCLGMHFGAWPLSQGFQLFVNDNGAFDLGVGGCVLLVVRWIGLFFGDLILSVVWPYTTRAKAGGLD
jgi:hypothetical protein